MNVFCCSYAAEKEEKPAAQWGDWALSLVLTLKISFTLMNWKFISKVFPVPCSFSDCKRRPSLEELVSQELNCSFYLCFACMKAV
ncbi:hypothetical protein Gasu2_43130 [Galdieria sulphuraria]|nr:hypothetical protein Gasu2_43130 [Galdieria sulphuraria]